MTKESQSIEYGTILLMEYPQVLTMEEPSEIWNLVVEQKKHSPKEFNKLMAAKALVETNFFWKDFSRFCHLCYTLLTGYVNTMFTPLPSIETMGWGVVEAVLLGQDDEITENPKSVFVTEILEYIKLKAKEENAYVFTLRPFLDLQIEDDPESNSWLVFRMKELLTNIEDVFKKYNMNISFQSKSDIDKKFTFLLSKSNPSL